MRNAGPPGGDSSDSAESPGGDLSGGDSSGSDLSRVSVVVPARNCAELLPGCLAAIDRQTYQGPVDVTVALAPSSDGTEQVLARCRTRLRMRVVDNPAGIASAGLNIAFAASQGPVVARVDAQARPAPDYLERAVAALRRTGAANVGGVQRPLRSEGLADAIAAAMSSPFGAGPAAFRSGRSSGPVDTVYLGVFDRDAVVSVGGFDETLLRNQDYELNMRLREQGRIVWLDAGLIVDYVPRSDYAGLAGQYFSYGAWKRNVLIRKPASLRPRQLAAPALVAALAVSVLQIGLRRRLGLAAPLLYAGACAAAAARLEDTGDGRRQRTRTAAAFAVMHLSWGAGFWFGRPWRRRTRRRLRPTTGETNPQRG